MFAAKAGAVMAPVLQGLGMAPTAFHGDAVDKLMGGIDAYGRVQTLFGIPQMASDLYHSAKDLVTGPQHEPSATEALGRRKMAAYGIPTDPNEPVVMPPSPMGSLMDLAAPFKHPINSIKGFVSGLGTEADNQLTRSMAEQPVNIHQLMYTNHPRVTY
jgi:hypothetical protein